MGDVMRSHAVTVKLNDDEYSLLRDIPAESDAARFRALLHSQSVAAAIAEAVADRLSDIVDPDRIKRIEPLLLASLAGQRALARVLYHREFVTAAQKNKQIDKPVPDSDRPQRSGAQRRVPSKRL